MKLQQFYDDGMKLCASTHSGMIAKAAGNFQLRVFYTYEHARKSLNPF